MHAASPSPASGPATDRQCVVLVHGYLANKLLLALLARRLRNRGYRTDLWGYRNMWSSIQVLADRFARSLAALDADPRIDTLHLVTHSMGGIIGRAALDRYRPRKLGRFVMLAPPNRGSFVATAMAGSFGRVLKPVAELSTAANSLVNSLPTPDDVDIGVIAAAHDALVSSESTHPPVPHDHVTLPTWHTGLLFRRDTADLVADFLASGRFPSPPPAAPGSPALPPEPRTAEPRTAEPRTGEA
jgi:alpha-beta hydrolase superfamily lysophospholipase